MQDMAASCAIPDEEVGKALNHTPYVDGCFLLHKI
jgi:hypothetical protein